MGFNHEISHVYRLHEDGSGYQVAQFRTFRDAHLMCEQIARSGDVPVVDPLRAGLGQNVVSWTNGDAFLTAPEGLPWREYLEYRSIAHKSTAEAWRALYGWSEDDRYRSTYSGPTQEVLEFIRREIPSLEPVVLQWAERYAKEDSEVDA